MRRLVGVAMLAVGCQGDSGIVEITAPPTVLITNPVDGDLVQGLIPLTLRGLVGDEDDNVTLLKTTWAVNGLTACDDPPDEAGIVTCEVVLDSSPTTISLDVLDPDGELGSAQISVEVQLNRPPTVEVALSPESPGTNDPVTAVAVATDPDDDAVTLTYAWTVDGEPVDEAGATLDSAHFVRGDTVEVTVSADDGAESGLDSASAVVVNTPPTAPGLVLSGEGGQDLVCEISTESEDADGDPVTYSASWTRDGQADSSSTTLWPGDTLTAGWEEELVCTMTPNDGFEDGQPGILTEVLDCRLGSAEGCPGDSCLHILDAGADQGDGTYWNDPMGGSAFQVDCDMTTDGGGWTGVSFAVAETWLEGTMTALESAATDGIDATYGPYTRDSGSAAHSYVYDLEFPPGFEAFYLSDYEIMANPVSGGSSDVWPAYFVRTDWSVAYAVATSCCYGDVAFGDADDAPVTSLAANLSARTHYSQGEVVSWPGGDDIYTLASAETFRVGWGDGGGESEGWYPWYSGAVYLR